MFDLKTKILIVDDMSTMRKMVMKACQAYGYTNFSEAADGTFAFSVLEKSLHIGLIISDWNMPNCSGLDLLKKVRSDSRFKSIPFILVTGEVEKGQMNKAMRAGASGYVVKPFTPEILAKKLLEVYTKTKE